MFKKSAAGVVAIAALVGSGFACSSPPVNSEGDGGAVTDASTVRPDTGRPDRGLPPEEDTGTGNPDGGSSVLDDDTVGNTCTNDADCEKNAATGGEEDKFCSNGGFTSGSLAPTPVCAGICRFDTTRPTAIQDCDKARGLCLQASGAQGVCLPACEWEEGSPVQGCQGNNKCEVYGFGKNAQTNKAIGVGICLGGCTSDAQCNLTPGEKCQVASGLCVKAADHKAVQDTTPPGTACSGRTNPTPACLCAAPASGPGICIRACVTGANGNVGTNPGQCPTGTICTADLPKTTSAGALFTAQPDGIQGTCRKTCTPDAAGDTLCAGGTANAGYCDTNDVSVAGAITGVCAPGPKPAAGG